MMPTVTRVCFSYVETSDYFWLCELTGCFLYLGVLELRCFMVLFGLLAVDVLNVLTGARVCWPSRSLFVGVFMTSVVLLPRM